MDEREKRLRPDADAQYLSPTDQFAHYLDDPYIDDAPERAPLSEEVEAALIGTGFGGMQAAAHLQQAGIDNFRILDRAGDFGGVWYWNRYPGIACDIESYIYLPLIEEMGYMPTEKICAWAGSLSVRARHGQKIRPVQSRTPTHRGTCASLGPTICTLGHHYRSRRRHSGGLRQCYDGAAAAAEVARQRCHRRPKIAHLWRSKMSHAAIGNAPGLSAPDLEYRATVMVQPRQAHTS